MRLGQSRSAVSWPASCIMHGTDGRMAGKTNRAACGGPMLGVGGRHGREEESLTISVGIWCSASSTGQGGHARPDGAAVGRALHLTIHGSSSGSPRARAGGRVEKQPRRAGAGSIAQQTRDAANQPSTGCLRGWHAEMVGFQE
jgi:hypothetical protein